MALLFSAAAQAAPPQLKISGNQIVNASSGCTVRLKGVDLSGWEYSPTGDTGTGRPTTTISGVVMTDYVSIITEAVQVWHANCVRFPINQDFWFNCSNSHGTPNETAYRAMIQAVINYCSSNNVYLDLDLHWSGTSSTATDPSGCSGGSQTASGWDLSTQQQPMPDMNAVTFWSSVAAVYANNPAVLFDLFNEPYDPSGADTTFWSVWRNGGSAGSYTTPGIQALLTAVRNTGANNVVVAGGLNWSFDLTGLPANDLTDTSSGNGVLYSAHVYSSKGYPAGGTQWDNFITNATATSPPHAVFIEEFGATSTDGAAWDNSTIAWLNGSNSKNYVYSGMAWAFSSDVGPTLLTSFSGYPTTSYHGAPVSTWLYNLNQTPTPNCGTGGSTPTFTPTFTKTATATSTKTASLTPTSSPTKTASATSTNTAANTPSATATKTPTNSPTRTATPTSTASPTNTTVNTATSTASKTATATPTNTPTNTPTATATKTPTATFTSTFTLVFSPTPTNTLVNTLTSTPTSTASRTPTSTATLTPTNTPVNTVTLTPSSTATRTATLTASPTVTNTPVNSFTPSSTATSTATATRTNTPLNTPTPTVTATFTGTFTIVSTPTATNTLVNTLTSTATSTASRTPTSTATLTPTNTPVNTVTATPSSTATRTATLTASPTVTDTPVNSFTPSSTATSTATATRTNTPLNTPTPTVTATFTGTFTIVFTATATNTPVNSVTATPTATSTKTATSTTTRTATLTTTNTPTATPTNSLVFTATPSFTPSATPTAVTLSAAPGSGAPGNSNQLPGTSNVPVQQVVLTNPSNSTITMTSVTLQVTGTGNPANITGVTLWANGTAITTTTFTGVNAVFNFTGTLAGPASVTYTFTVNFGTNAAGSYSFSLTGAGGTNGQAAQFTGLPVVGATVTVVPATSTPTLTATLTPTATPSFTPTVSSTPTSTWTAAFTATLTPTATRTATLPTPAGTPVLFPNPVSGGGSFQLNPALVSASDVHVTYFTVTFRRVNDLAFKAVLPGTVLTLPLTDKRGTDLASGLYYIVVQTQQGRSILKLLVLR